MKILTRKRVENAAITIAALMQTNLDMLGEGMASGINLGLFMIAEELGMLPEVQRILNIHCRKTKEDEENEAGN